MTLRIWILSNDGCSCAASSFSFAIYYCVTQQQVVQGICKAQVARRMAAILNFKPSSTSSLLLLLQLFINYPSPTLME